MSKEKDKAPEPACQGLELKSILVNKSRPDERHMLAVARVLLAHPALWDNTNKDYHFPSKRREAIAAAARALQVDVELAGELLRRVRSKYYAFLSKMRNGRLPETVYGAPCPAWLQLLHKHLYTPETVNARLKEIPEAVHQKTEHLMTVLAEHALQQGGALGRGPHPALERSTGYSSRVLLIMWAKIRTMVLDKFAVLCAASDEEGNVIPPARLTPAAWRCLDVLLLYELAPAAPHDAGQIPYEQTGPLIALFHLVQKYKAEEEPPRVPPGGWRAWELAAGGVAAELQRLRKAWNDVHHEYLEQGRTQSLVSLQWRWWWCRAAAAAALARAAHLAHQHAREPGNKGRVPRPAPLLLAIARRYPGVVTGAPVAWAERVQGGRVFLNDAMYEPREVRHAQPAAALLQPLLASDVALLASDAEPTPEDAEDDLILVENEIETIDLDLQDLNSDQPEPEKQSKNSLFEDIPDLMTVDPDKAECRVIFESDSDSDSDSGSDDSPKVKLESIDEEITKLNESIQNEILGFFSDSNCEFDKETEPSGSADVNKQISLIDNIEEIVVDTDSNETTDPMGSNQVENQDKEISLVENQEKVITEGDNASFLVDSSINIDKNQIENQNKHIMKEEEITCITADKNQVDIPDKQIIQVKNHNKKTEEAENVVPLEKSITTSAADNITLPLDNLQNKNISNEEQDITASAVAPEATAPAGAPEEAASAFEPQKDLTSQINEILRSVPSIPHRRADDPVKHEIDIEEHITKGNVASIVKSETLSREVLEYRRNILRGLEGEGGEFRMGSEGGSVASIDDTEATIDPKLTMTPRVILSDLKHVPAWAQHDDTSIDYNTLKEDNVYCLTVPVRHIQDLDLSQVAEEINALFPEEKIGETNEESKKIEETKKKDELLAINITLIPAAGPKKVYLNVASDRSYTTTKLCKNPDFNTRLKRLSDAFFLSERNRELLTECLPVTIDIQKVSEARVAKLERPGREASKVSLLSIDDVRRINSRILTAEVTPITAARGDEVIEVDSGPASGDSDDDWRPAAVAQSALGRGGGRLPTETPEEGPPCKRRREERPLKMRWGPTGPVFTQQVTINNSKYVPTKQKKPALSALELKRTLRFLDKSGTSGAGTYCCQARRHRAVNDARRRHALRQRRRAPHPSRIHTHSPAECTCCCKRLLSADSGGAAAAAAAAASLAALVQAPDVAAAAAAAPDEPDESANSETAPQLWDRPRSPSPPASPTQDQIYYRAPDSDPTPTTSDPPATTPRSSLSCARVRPREPHAPKRPLALSTIRKRMWSRRKEKKRKAAEEAAKEAGRKKTRDDYQAWLDERDFASKKFGFKPRQQLPPPPPKPKVDLQAVASQMVVEKPPLPPTPTAPLPPAAPVDQGPVLVSSSSIHVVDLDDDTPPNPPQRMEGVEEMATVVRILEDVTDNEQMPGGALLRPNASAEASKTVPLSNLPSTSSSNQLKPIKITVKFKEKPNGPTLAKTHVMRRQRISVGHISKELGPRLASLLGGHGELTQENLYRHQAETGGVRGAGEGEVVELSDDDEDTATPPVTRHQASVATPRSAKTPAVTKKLTASPVLSMPSLDKAPVTTQASVAKPVIAPASVVTTAATATIATTTATKATTTPTVQRKRAAHCSRLVRGPPPAPLPAAAWLAAAPQPPPPLLEVDIVRPILRLGSSAVVVSSVAPTGSLSGTLWAPRPPSAPPTLLHFAPEEGARMMAGQNTYRMIKKQPPRYVQVLFVLSTAQEVRDLVLQGATLHIFSTDSSAMHPLNTIPSPSPSSSRAPRPKRPPIALNCVGNRRALAHLVHALNTLSKNNQNQDVVTIEDDAQGPKTYTAKMKEKDKEKEREVIKDRSLLKPDVQEAVKEAQKLQSFTSDSQMASLRTLAKLCRLKPICDAEALAQNAGRDEAAGNVRMETGEDSEEKVEESEKKERESKSRTESNLGELGSDTTAVESESYKKESETKDKKSNLWGTSDKEESDEDNDEGRLMMDIPDDSPEKVALNDSNGLHSTDVKESGKDEQAMDVEEAGPLASIDTADLDEMDVASEDGGDCILGM